MDAMRVFFFFVFSLLIGLANTLFRMQSLSGALRFFLHFLISTLAFFCCFLLPLNMGGSSAIVGVILFMLIYFLVAGIIALFASRFRKNRDQEEQYQRQYTAKK